MKIILYSNFIATIMYTNLWFTVTRKLISMLLLKDLLIVF